MAKPIHGIKTLKSMAINGKNIDAGVELLVPKDVSEDDARLLLKMQNRAEEIPAPEAEKPETPEAPAVQDDAELKSLLDKTIPEIAAALQARDEDGKPVISDEQIEVLYKAETDGNTRVGVMDAIKEELEARKADKGLLKRLFGRNN